MNVLNVLKWASDAEASDVHFVVGNPPIVRMDGVLKTLDEPVLEREDTEMYARYMLNDSQYKIFETSGQVDLAYRLEDGSTYRINVFRYSGKTGIACRVIKDKIPTAKELELPEIIEKVSDFTSGLVLVTGPTGCGKSTTIATIIDSINKKKNCHILTIEDPIEYVHKNDLSIITQREVGSDCNNFPEALRAGLRQDPDVIMVGEMRDLETISTAVTAAETGHLVLATLHTRNAYQTIERIIDVFPSAHQQQIRVQLANSLMAVFSQRLLPRKRTTGRIAAVESLIVTHAVRNLIRENKVHQLYTAIQTGQRLGMQTMDDYLIKLYQNHTINRVTLLENVTERDAVLKVID
ncbi:type IV pilus twitching motility protein PilT [Fusibacter tunisiensis]|uniref:Twitching motility protein PilT n=1 Tax=Fusibacter tunisiensis TaxID=1008308 RepID=A0ABS2MTF0_9FIRM|nr:type IV pilus twitching motility protein PilT [Fusibacter tunisiensis]MBM7562688.1 twitching motility protein PilT [Fusibacter tunisiensis]